MIHAIYNSFAKNVTSRKVAFTHQQASDIGNGGKKIAEHFYSIVEDAVNF
jgi:hypothetical protein